MAAGLARKLVAEQIGCPSGELRKHGVEIGSAGLFAGGGSKATHEAAQAMDAMGVDLSRHRSRQLSRELIDEADLFVAAEAGRGFPLLSAFRTLSAEGRVHFILAGFWELYRTVGFDYQSPLRNFGDELRLGPLERDAALKLATEPMAALNLHYADPALPERIYERTGGRANLIAIVCDRLLAGLDGRTRVIDAAAVNRVPSRSGASPAASPRRQAM